MSVHEVVFRPDDLSPVLAALDPAGWVNLRPEIDESEGSPPPLSTSWVSSVFSSKGPVVALATWHPGERSAGIQHASGPKLARRVDVPAGWRVAQDHPRRGLVLRVPVGVPDVEVLRWLVAASAPLTDIRHHGRWVGEVHSP